MKTTKLEEFAAIVCDPHFSVLCKDSAAGVFLRICIQIRANPVALNVALIKSLGTSGPGIIKRTQIVATLVG